MTINILEPKETEMTSAASVTFLQEIAETVQLDALQYARSKSTQPMRAAGLEELLQRREFIDHFRIGLADRIAKTLAAHDKNVKAIYYFDPNLNPDAETEAYSFLDPSVNLLVQVEEKSAALLSFIAALDKALVEQVNELPSSMYDSLKTILNGIIITDADVEQKHGYAVLLSSFYLKPRKVW